VAELPGFERKGSTIGLRGPLPTKGISAEQVNTAIAATLGSQPSIPAPASLDAIGRKLWNRLCPPLLKLGLMTELDATLLESYCMAYSRLLAAQKVIDQLGPTMCTDSGYQQPRPEVAIINKATDQLVKIGRELGLSPAIRTRLVAGQDATADELESMLTK